jgi:hypothetical protein
VGSADDYSFLFVNPVNAAGLSSGDIAVRLAYDDDPDLVHLVSIAELRRTPPRSSQLTYPCSSSRAPWSGFTTCTTLLAERPARLSSPSLAPFFAMERPHQSNVGHSTDLDLQSDTACVGILPPTFMKTADSAIYTLGALDYVDSWVQPSHLCDRGHGLLLPRLCVCLPADTIFKVYTGHDNKNLRIGYPQAQKLFANSDYVLAAFHSSYVMDGQNGSSICGPSVKSHAPFLQTLLVTRYP